MTMAPPGTEQLYLRMLLNHVGGPKSFNDLKIHMELFNNKKKLHLQMDYYTMMLNMMHACKKQNFQQCQIKSDDYWLLYSLFCDPVDVAGLFHRHFDAMAEDQRQATKRQKQISVIYILNSQLQPFSMQMSNLIDVPAFIGDAFIGNNMSFPNYDDTTHDNKCDVEDIIKGLNDNQRLIFGQVCATVRNSDNAQDKMCFIDGPGGTGKTYLYIGIWKYYGVRDSTVWQWQVVE